VKKVFFFFVLLGAFGAAMAEVPGADWKPLADFWGAAGWQQEGFYVLGFPRSDLNVMVEGTPLETALGLTSHLRFKALSKGLEVEGELVLLDQESRRVEDKLILDGFKLQDFGDLLVGETPAVKVLEFSGKGTVSVLDAQLKEALGLTGTPLTPLSFPPPAPGAAADWLTLQGALGQKGFIQGKVLWLLAPPFTPASDPALGFFSLKLQRDGPTLLVLGESILDVSQVSALLKILAHNKMTVTSLRPFGTVGGALRLRWWGSGDEGKMAPVLQKIISLGGEAPEEPQASPAAVEGF
jgi:hypothetical protein